MILKGSQRGGAKQLATHLMNRADNDQVEVHEVRGFVADDVQGAMQEAYAVSRGTQAKQFLFSVSLNPPQDENVRPDVFETALAKIEERNGLVGQPRIVVFHEKEGRRHCHCVWSRIDPVQMKAINLPFFKTKLREVSKELYLEHGWSMPKGLRDHEARDPLNYGLAEYQQAKRGGHDPRDLKSIIQESWAVSDGKAGFEAALRAQGLFLAKGDRRGFVVLNHSGEALGLGRSLGKKTKDITAKLGNPNEHRSIDAAQNQIAELKQGQFGRLISEARDLAAKEMAPLQAERSKTNAKHQAERNHLQRSQQERWQVESMARASRLNSGVRGLWDRVTGKHRRTQKQNEMEALFAFERDREQRQELIASQLAERQALQSRILSVRSADIQRMRELFRDQKAAKQESARQTPLAKPKPQKRLEVFREAAQAQPQEPDRREPKNPRPKRKPSRSSQERLAALRNRRSQAPANRNRGPTLER